MSLYKWWITLHNFYIIMNKTHLWDSLIQHLQSKEIVCYSCLMRLTYQKIMAFIGTKKHLNKDRNNIQFSFKKLTLLKTKHIKTETQVYNKMRYNMKCLNAIYPFINYLRNIQHIHFTFTRIKKYFLSTGMYKNTFILIRQLESFLKIIER